MEIKEYKTMEPISVPFIWKDPTPGGSNLGRAEFQICAEHKRNKITGFYVYHKQQRNIEFYWHYVGNLYDGLSLTNYVGSEHCDVWMAYWCTEHKSLSMILYVPSNAKFINLDHNGIGFTDKPWYKIPEVLNKKFA